MARCDSHDDVLHYCERFLQLISKICNPEDLCFLTSARDAHQIQGIREFCESADRVAHGGNDSLATLTLLRGNTNSFDINGVHAVGVLNVEENTSLRIGIIIVLLVILLLCIFLLK